MFNNTIINEVPNPLDEKIEDMKKVNADNY